MEAPAPMPSYLKRIAAAVDSKRPGRGHTVIRRILERYPQIFDRNVPLMIDEPAARFGHAGSLLLASYQALLDEGFDRDGALAMVTEAYRDYPPAIKTRWGVRLLLLLARDRMASLSRMWSSKKNEAKFGRGYRFEYAGDDQSFTMTVRRCFCHQFCVANGAPELTSAFCKWDQNWIDEIKPAKHGMRFERPKTFAQGDEVCIFRLVRC